MARGAAFVYEYIPGYIRPVNPRVLYTCAESWASWLYLMLMRRKLMGHKRKATGHAGAQPPNRPTSNQLKTPASALIGREKDKGARQWKYGEDYKDYNKEESRVVKSTARIKERNNFKIVKKENRKKSEGNKVKGKTGHRTC